MIYQDEDFLQLSGLQHFKFCRRQWALIHVEKQWAENYHTTDGAIMHENAHDGSFTESRGDLVITRDMRVFSRTLGVSGACGALYYREPRRRTEVDFTPELRQEVRALLEEMHALYARGSTPKVKPTKGCNACSLKGLCLPKLMRSKSVSAYLRGAMEGEQ